MGLPVVEWCEVVVCRQEEKRVERKLKEVEPFPGLRTSSVVSTPLTFLFVES